MSIEIVKKGGKMKYLNQVRQNRHFYIDKGLLFNINQKDPIADLSDGQYLRDDKRVGKVREAVELFASGAKVTIECSGEKCVQFFGNDGKKLTETVCHKWQNKENISILPIDLGVFSSHYVNRNRLVYMFVDYKSDIRFMNHNFTNVYKAVKTHLEDKVKNNINKLGSEKFKSAITTIKREETERRRA